MSKLKFKKVIEVDIDISNVIEEINLLHQNERWNIIARMLNEINVDNTDLGSNQREAIRQCLANKLILFNKLANAR